MRVAISNIAWDVTEDPAVAEILRARGVDAIDVVPGKYFPDAQGAAAEEIATVREWWAERGIEITGMQALLFGTTGLNVFGSVEARQAMVQRLAHVCRIGDGLGARRLVFGSPKNRDRGNLEDDEVDRIAVEFFRRLGDVAADYRVVVCLEPNPAAYGCNFMTTTMEASRVVRLVDHPAIRLQLDTGALAMTGEDPETIIGLHHELIGHVHASEPHLVTLGDGNVRHDAVAAALRRFASDRVVSVEMLASVSEHHSSAIDRALGVAVRFYGNGGGRAGAHL